MKKELKKHNTKSDKTEIRRKLNRVDTTLKMQGVLRILPENVDMVSGNFQPIQVNTLANLLK